MSLYLALGDSITSGYGVDRSSSFPTIYANFLARHHSDLHLLNQGVNGLTTSELLELLKFNKGLRHSISQAVLITITIGSNDLLSLMGCGNLNQALNPSQLPFILKNMAKTLAHVGEEVRRLNSSATVKVATLYNPLPAGPYAPFNALAQRVIASANRIIVSWAKQYGAVVVFLDREIRGKEHLLIGQDYAHPNEAGYQVIAKAFARY
ncbi:SGNH/GDSL hydrolase family protein [Desulfosporosinus sp. Sb-LF]|nr:SGNH/GDSL hydrolase family protein [Desulfosporosinus sp. Sb-LF]